MCSHQYIQGLSNRCQNLSIFYSVFEVLSNLTRLELSFTASFGFRGLAEAVGKVTSGGLIPFSGVRGQGG